MRLQSETKKRKKEKREHREERWEKGFMWCTQSMLGKSKKRGKLCRKRECRYEGRESRKGRGNRMKGKRKSWMGMEEYKGRKGRKGSGKRIKGRGKSRKGTEEKKGEKEV
jgi:hypothetical protein